MRRARPGLNDKLDGVRRDLGRIINILGWGGAAMATVLVGVAGWIDFRGQT